MRSGKVSTVSTERGKQLRSLTGVESGLSNVQTNIFGIVERLHEPPRRMYRRVRCGYLNVSSSMVIKLAVQATNGTVGEPDSYYAALFL